MYWFEGHCILPFLYRVDGQVHGAPHSYLGCMNELAVIKGALLSPWIELKRLLAMVEQVAKHTQLLEG